MRFNTIEERVTDILKKYPETRDSDDLLFISYLQYHDNENGTHIINTPIAHYIRHYKDLGIPPLESITRIRRKVQKIRPDLAPTKTVKGFRGALEHEYREYAKE